MKCVSALFFLSNSLIAISNHTCHPNTFNITSSVTSVITLVITILLTLLPVLHQQSYLSSQYLKILRLHPSQTHHERVGAWLFPSRLHFLAWRNKVEFVTSNPYTATQPKLTYHPIYYYKYWWSHSLKKSRGHPYIEGIIFWNRVKIQQHTKKNTTNYEHGDHWKETLPRPR